MAAPIDFYFDFSSPYGYIASHRIDAIAAKHGRAVNWRPYLLGVAFKTTGMAPLSEQPMRGEYSLRDISRSARFHGVTLVMPEPFPVNALAPSRAYYWLLDQDAEEAKTLAKALFGAYFAAGRNVSQAEVVADVAAEQGGDRAALLAALGDPAVKDRLRRETDEALERGAFGSPFVFVDGEPFWGNDRLDMVDKWLETGGW